MSEEQVAPPEAYRFKAEIKQLLDILAHSLYKERDIWLRELISNASDALTRMHFESLTNRDVVDPNVAVLNRDSKVTPLYRARFAQADNLVRRNAS